MTLSKSKIAKLTPEQRKARDKAIAYKRQYHAKHRRKAKITHDLTGVKITIKDLNGNFDRAEILFRELRDTNLKRQAIIDELKTIML